MIHRCWKRWLGLESKVYFWWFLMTLGIGHCQSKMTLPKSNKMSLRIKLKPIFSLWGMPTDCVVASLLGSWSNPSWGLSVWSFHVFSHAHMAFLWVMNIHLNKLQRSGLTEEPGVCWADTWWWRNYFFLIHLPAGYQCHFKTSMSTLQLFSCHCIQRYAILQGPPQKSWSKIS